MSPRCLLVVFVGPLAAQTLWTPEHFYKQRSAYAGAQLCAACHEDIYKKQNASNHTRTLRPVTAVTEIATHLPFQLYDRTSGSTLIVSRGLDNGIVLIARSNASEDRLALEWAFGSGIKGITPVGRLSNGSLAESRVSWYSSVRGFDFTTGATRFVPHTNVESLGRPLERDAAIQCLACHTTGVTDDQLSPARDNMGVRCERCHGPGAEHIEAMKGGSPVDKKIFRPDSLDGFAQAQMCGVCHGTPPQETDFETIRSIQNSANTIRFPSQRLVLSRCFNETDSGLRCTVCHDPHTDVASQLAALERVCIACHTPGKRRRPEVCTVAKQNCVSCHMARRHVMAHSMFTDHWIRIVRDKPAVQ